MIDFSKIEKADKEVYDLIMAEYNRQNNCLELIASENEPSEAVLLAQASYHTLKYAEGYPNKRYYGGCEIIDKTEQLAIDRACQLFGCKYANVQPHSGSQANMAVQFALMRAHQTLIGMSLNSGGHLTHGAKPTFSGKAYNVYQYEVNPNTMEIDYDEIKTMLYEKRPRLFIAGASAYPRGIDFEKIAKLITEYNEWLKNDIMENYGEYLLAIDKENAYEDEKCYFMVDMAHIAGLVAAGLHQSPIPYADVVTTTTHKTLRGPRGGLILTNREDLITKINKAVFPGIQGGPLENIIAAKAICFGEALKPEFKEYMQNVVNNTKILADTLTAKGHQVLTNGTDNHLLLLDLREEEISGAELEKRLENIGIVSNKNAVPFDTKNKKETSGLRLGAAAVTSRGLNSDDMVRVAEIISDCIAGNKFECELCEEVQNICAKYPLYSDK